MLQRSCEVLEREWTRPGASLGCQGEQVAGLGFQIVKVCVGGVHGGSVPLFLVCKLELDHIPSDDTILSFGLLPSQSDDRATKGLHLDVLWRALWLC